MRSDVSSRKPSFLWQAGLILLPVVVLTVVGLFSLHQDRLLAEQEARELGTLVAQRLAQAINVEAVRRLMAYRDASENLRFARMGTLGLGDAGADWNSVQVWQQANPDIDLFNLPPAICCLHFIGDDSLPQTYSPAPAPPDWLLKLSPEQRRLWDQAERAEYAEPPAAVLAAITNFLGSLSVLSLDGARASAEFHRLQLQTRGLSPAAAVTEWMTSDWARSGELDEAGVPVGQLICYQALRLLPDQAGVPPRLFTDIAYAILARPCLLSPRLIAETERVARPEPADARQGVAVLKAWWNADEPARQIIGDFTEQHPAGTWTNSLYWRVSSSGNYLLVLCDNEDEHLLRPPPKVPLFPLTLYTGRPKLFAPHTIYRLLVLPELVVEKALDQAVAGAGLSVPPYATVRFEIGRAEFNWSGNRLTAVTNASPLPLLGEATATLTDLPLNTNAYPLGVRVLLADPGALYARQQQRTLWFGALILASTVAALAGLLAAHRAFRRQQELNDLKSNFVSSVSHELRAPIASVRLMAENLAGGKIPGAQRQQEYFSFIVQECRRLSSLIENVLDFSRIEQGRKQYEFEPTNLSALTQTTVKLMEPYALEKGVTLLLLPADPPETASALEITVDGRAIQQALVNLLDNAIKHSAKGETVTVGLVYKNDLATPVVQLFVADHGPGIPTAEQEKIFERFYRLGSELRRETQGIGIGLSIVKHIVEAHGGRVIVQSAPGQGSRFTIELPVRRSNE